MACPTVSTPYGLALVVSSTTRPTTPPDLTAGRIIFEADTLRTLLYDGTGWIIMSEPLILATTLTGFLTGATLGNGTVDISHHRSDGFCDFNLDLNLGSTSSVAGPFVVTVPYAARAIFWAGQVHVGLRDSGTADLIGTITSTGSSSTFGAGAVLASGTYAVHTAVTSTVPFTWTTGDRLTVSLRYPMSSRYS